MNGRTGENADGRSVGYSVFFHLLVSFWVVPIHFLQNGVYIFPVLDLFRKKNDQIYYTKFQLKFSNKPYVPTGGTTELSHIFSKTSVAVIAPLFNLSDKSVIFSLRCLSFARICCNLDLETSPEARWNKSVDFMAS